MEMSTRGRYLQRWIPARVVFVALGFLGFCLVYAYKVMLSMAILAMVKDSTKNSTISMINYESSDTCPGSKDSEDIIPGELDWDDKKDTVLASFFWGYVLTQIPAGIAANKIGGKWIFGLSLLIAAICSLLGPVTARYSYSMFMAIRVIQGLAEGVVFPCMNGMLARWMPKMERTIGSTIIFTGSQIGNVITLPMTAQLNETSWGWPSTFYLLGIAGIVWFIFYTFLVYETPEVHPFISQAECDYIIHNGGGIQTNQKMVIPYKKIFTSPAVYGLMLTHFGQNWAFLTIMIYMPFYMSDVLHTSTSQKTLLSGLPFLGQAIFSWICSVVTDKTRASGRFEITTIRKFNNFLAYIPGAILFLLVPVANCDKTLSCFLLILAITFNGAVFSALNCTHLDMAPDFAGTLMGLTNSFGNIPGFAVPPVVKHLTNNEPTVHSWSYVFYLAAGVNVITTVVYTVLCTAKEQSWGRMKKNEPPELFQSIIA